MTSGPDDERRQSSEPTFADVMNGFSFDSGRSPRRRKWGRRRGADVELNDDVPKSAEQRGGVTPAPPAGAARTGDRSDRLPQPRGGGDQLGDGRSGGPALCLSPLSNQGSDRS